MTIVWVCLGLFALAATIFGYCACVAAGKADEQAGCK